MATNSFLKNTFQLQKMGSFDKKFAGIHRI